jgi:hypothetical protein
MIKSAQNYPVSSILDTEAKVRFVVPKYQREYNSKLGNKSFADKRDRKDAAGKMVGYKNGLHLNGELRDRENWTVNDIQERTKELVKEAVGLFSI